MIPLLLPLAGALIDIFTPLAKEKITKEIGRHTENPAVAEQVAAGVIDAARAITGQADPIAAVAAAKADPALAAQVEAAALDNLAKLAPMLDKVAQWDAQAWAAEEQSRDAAAKRAADDPHDQDVFLTRSIVLMVAAMMLGVAALIGLLAWLKVDSTIVSALAALFTTLAGTVIGKFSTRYDHRYGGSRSSGAKDVLIAELSRRR